MELEQKDCLSMIVDGSVSCKVQGNELIVRCPRCRKQINIKFRSAIGANIELEHIKVTDVMQFSPTNTSTSTLIQGG